MALPAALMVAGTALQVFGQYQANMAQAQDEIANSIFYKEQASFAFESGLREAAIAKAKYSNLIGAQTSAYAHGGVDLSGSAGTVLASTMANKHLEILAIDKKRDLDFRLAMLRSRQAQATGETLQSLSYNLTQAGGTILTSAAKSYDSGSAPSWTGKATASSSITAGESYANYSGTA